MDVRIHQPVVGAVIQPVVVAEDRDGLPERQPGLLPGGGSRRSPSGRRCTGRRRAHEAPSRR
eukprot:13998177-Alexandrium_andersonii.AAC.1